MKHRAAFIAAVVIASMVSMGCSSYKESSGDPDAAAAHEAGMNARVQETITAFRTADPSLSGFFDNAYGYAVFPKIAKGGAGLGGAHGEGLVYERGAVIGNTSMSQATIGLQLGGQTLREIIFFQNAQKLDDFKNGKVELSAQASAVAARDGAAGSTDYTEGVAVFVLPIKGLMGEASVGGQKFEYSPISR
ncbi:MAG: hypothetical protein IT444_05555 [Phycisphaeraceae bacterium]|nr:hypothetical protein [Phycisphaeraceae bacterium]